ncbi:LysR family transcriptional regulator [Roseococcus sp. SYP-B2431]|uniref:LysR family transcriptional regulator n=1 Tax=Roseococcus sp. SYP-B2431 TaxID=2496640 RepID=UPI0010407396|nr:LysR family transcriptional regulator [Roseococcus sp. SYP-B2431]TCH98358.1 LysR family transcriptional regulator [Roseococcus sp. SYP-B2431]
MRTFLSVAETGSVSASARALGVTQPAASQQLREMERRLGVRLLERAAGRSIPTAAGEALIPAARRALAAAADAEDAVVAHREGAVGRIRLGTGATACIHLLPPALAALRRRVPGVEVIVETGNTPEIVQRVDEGLLDIAVVTLPVSRRRSLEFTPLVRESFLALAPDGLVAGSGPIGAAALARLPLILYEAGGVMRRLVDDWLARGNTDPHVTMELDSIEAIKVLVAIGLGASILPEFALRQPISGTLCYPLRPALARQLAIVLRREKTRDRALRVFLEEVTKLTSKSPAQANAAR